MRIFAVMSAMVLLFQNCSNIQFLNLTPNESTKSEVASTTMPTSSAAGNGGTYDGKLRILHHYVQDFKCEGRPQPESILVRKTEKDWVVIRNTVSKCRDVDQAPVTGVVYDDVTKIGSFEGKTYIPPKPYHVIATEDPNSPDAYVIDGVCENANGKCSLLAATQTAGAVSSTDSVLVEIAAGIYKLNAALGLTYPYPSHPVTFHGVSSGSTVLDGQNKTHHFQLGGGPPSTNFQSISFINGNNGAVKSASSISFTLYTTTSYSGGLSIEDCLFKDNSSNPVLFFAVTAGPLTVKRSQFEANSEDAINTEGNRFTIEDTLISNNGRAGIYLGNSYSVLKLKNSSIVNNGTYGVYTSNCYGCAIENSTIYNNKLSGLNIITSAPVSAANFDFVVRNSTIYNNATASGSSIQLLFMESGPRLILNNSVISTNNPAKANCGFTSPYAHDIVATNSLFDDSTCAASGSGNLFTNPQLGALAMNGGFTPTLLPLSGSPLMDAGDNLTCTSVDQRALPRPVEKLGAGARCDIGAIEVQ